MALRIKDNVDLKELEKFGFENGIFTRKLGEEFLYQVVITKTHRLVQIKTFARGTIAKSLQDLLYDLIQAGLIEKL